MSASKLLIGVVGLVTLVSPIQSSSSKIPDEHMEIEIHTRTNEISKEVKLQQEFVSTHAEFIPEEEYEKEIVEEEWIEVNIHVSYYTDLQCENTINKETTDALGGKLVRGTIAIPRSMPLGTKFIIEGFDGEYIGKDRGSRKYIKWIDGNTMKIDMYIARIYGESDDDYFKRVNSKGITKTTGKYLLPKE